jgi:hypothetical protein
MQVTLHFFSKPLEFLVHPGMVKRAVKLARSRQNLTLNSVNAGGRVNFPASLET